MLLSAGASLEAKDAIFTTPLCFAILRGNLDAAKALVEAGASLEASGFRSANGNFLPPLVYAIRVGNVDVVKALIEMGASPTECDPSVGPLSPLQFAVFSIFDHKNVFLIKVLFEAERASKDRFDLLSQEEVDRMRLSYLVLRRNLALLALFISLHS